MTGKAPAEKMRYKPGLSLMLLRAPENMRAMLGFPADVTVTDDPRAASFILAFAGTQAEAEEALTELAPHVEETTLAWLAYPKGSKAAGHDVNRDTIWAFAQTMGLTAVASIAVDDTWSALRLRPLKR